MTISPLQVGHCNSCTPRKSDNTVDLPHWNDPVEVLSVYGNKENGIILSYSSLACSTIGTGLATRILS